MPVTTCMPVLLAAFAFLFWFTSHQQLPLSPFCWLYTVFLTINSRTPVLHLCNIKLLLRSFAGLYLSVNLLKWLQLLAVLAAVYAAFWHWILVSPDGWLLWSPTDLLTEWDNNDFRKAPHVYWVAVLDLISDNSSSEHFLSLVFALGW